MSEPTDSDREAFRRMMNDPDFGVLAAVELGERLVACVREEAEQRIRAELYHELRHWYRSGESPVLFARILASLKVGEP